MTGWVVAGAGAVVLFTGTAVLAFSVVAKLATWPQTRLAWPVGGGAAVLAGPVVVTVAEAGVLAMLLAGAVDGPAVPAAARLGLLGVVYAGYAVAALVLRGRGCGCFGGWLPTRFTLAHAAACAVLAAAAVTAVLSPPAQAPARAATAAAFIAAAAAGAALWHRDHRRSAGAVLPDPARIDYIVIFTSTTCGFCAALLAQRDRYQAIAGRRLEFRDAVGPADQAAADNAYPAAVAYDHDGQPVSAPAHGLARIRDLLAHSAATSPAQAPRARRPAPGPRHRPRPPGGMTTRQPARTQAPSPQAQAQVQRPGGCPQSATLTRWRVRDGIEVCPMPYGGAVALDRGQLTAALVPADLAALLTSPPAGEATGKAQCPAGQDHASTKNAQDPVAGQIRQAIAQGWLTAMAEPPARATGDTGQGSDQ